eukprot:Skav226693  [mRNA]  locus=scaffold3971:177343:178068:- [translate_table: standard]
MRLLSALLWHSLWLPSHCDLPDVACTFEEGFCGWYNGDDSYQWSSRTGSTPSSHTGPSAAKEGNYYLYVEASGNYPYKAEGHFRCHTLKYFWLYSPSFSSQRDWQFSFWFHMSGSTMGTLSLWAYHSSGESIGWSTLWYREGDQSPDWLWTSIVVPSSVSRLCFGGKTGWSSSSDIAIDALATSLGEI